MPIFRRNYTDSRRKSNSKEWRRSTIFDLWPLNMSAYKRSFSAIKFLQGVSVACYAEPY